MEKKDDTREALEARIEAAFASRLRPADDDLALRNEDFASYEGNQAAAYFAARAVPEVSYASMIETLGPEPGECFAFLQAEGLCFFLPAFLRIALDVEGTSDFSSRLASATPRATRCSPSSRTGARPRRDADNEGTAVKESTHLARKALALLNLWPL